MATKHVFWEPRSLHFAMGFENGKIRSWKNRVHTFLKKHAVPQAPEKKRHVLQIVLPKLPPVCIGDDKPCCEREAWKKMPIVSPMCRKCAVSCGTNEGKESSGDKLKAHIRKEHENLGVKYPCQSCGLVFDDYHNMNRHKLKVHSMDNRYSHLTTHI